MGARKALEGVRESWIFPFIPMYKVVSPESVLVVTGGG